MAAGDRGSITYIADIESKLRLWLMQTSQSSKWNGSSVTAFTDGNIATVSLDRPTKSNALDEQAFSELPQARHP